MFGRHVPISDAYKTFQANVLEAEINEIRAARNAKRRTMVFIAIGACLGLAFALPIIFQ